MRPLKFLAFFYIGLCFLTGCSKRKNPADSPLPPEGLFLQTNVRFVGTLDRPNNGPFDNNIRPETDVRTVRVYTPFGYKSRGQGRPFPTLYLLHDFNANDSYFGIYELPRLLDRMIASGEIQPMIVVQVDASNFYGGGFYTNSPATARYFTMIDSALVKYADSTYNTVFGRRSRALSGHGMGGYGALQVVLTGSDTTFGSVSALSAPLAFEGSASNPGFRDSAYVNAFFRESGVTPGDLNGYRNNIVPDPFQPNLFKTTLLFAMAAAFSPVDSTFDGVVDSLSTAQQQATINFFQFSKTARDAGLFFPWDQNGAIIPSAWNRWLAHSIDRLLAVNGGRLDSTPVFLSCGIDDPLGMLAQNRVFRDSLISRGFTQTPNFAGMTRTQFFKNFYYEEYSGYPGRPADRNTFVADQLAKVLKFHSQFLETAQIP